MPDYSQIADTIATRTAQQYGLNPGYFKAMFHAQINQESGFNPTAHSPAGALGIAQIVPKWHPGVNTADPVASLNYAAKWDAQNYKKYGNPQDVLSVYNSGRPWSVGQGIGETKNYVNSILGAANGGKPGPVWHPPTSDGGGGVGPLRPPGGSGGGQRSQMIQFLLNNALSATGSKPMFGQGGGSLLTAMMGQNAPQQQAQAPQTPLGPSPLAPKGVHLVTLPPNLVAGGSGEMNAPAASQAAALARQFGVKISSGYRDAQRNAAVGGAGSSDHLSGNAADFIGSPQAMKALYAFAQRHGYAYVEPWAQAKDHVHISFYRGGVKA